MFIEKLKNLIPSFGQESPFFLTIDLNSDTLKVYLNEVVIVENEEKIRIRKEYKEHVSEEVFSYGEVLDSSKLKNTLNSVLQEIKKDFKERVLLSLNELKKDDYINLINNN